MARSAAPMAVAKAVAHVLALTHAITTGSARPASLNVTARTVVTMGVAVYAVCAQTAKGALTKANVRAVRRVQGFVVAPAKVASATSFASIRVTAAMISALSVWMMLL